MQLVKRLRVCLSYLSRTSDARSATTSGCTPEHPVQLRCCVHGVETKPVFCFSTKCAEAFYDFGFRHTASNVTNCPQFVLKTHNLFLNEPSRRVLQLRKASVFYRELQAQERSGTARDPSSLWGPRNICSILTAQHRTGFILLHMLAVASPFKIVITFPNQVPIVDKCASAQQLDRTRPIQTYGVLLNAHLVCGNWLICRLHRWYALSPD